MCSSSERKVVQVFSCLIFFEILINTLVWSAFEIVFIHSSNIAYVDNKDTVMVLVAARRLCIKNS